jgi:hypothetical protein
MKNLPKINLVWDALHGMAYYIFLKSLRSLEEFRKNPHVKIPPKSCCANFQDLVNSKIQFLIRKFFFLISARPPPLFFFQPTHGPPPPSRTGPVGQNLSVFRTCLFFIATELVRFRYLSVFSSSKLVRFGLKTCPMWPLRPQAATHALSPLGPFGPSRVGVFAERRILFDYAHSGRDTFSLSRHCHVGPACQLHPLPPPPADRCHSSPPATSCCPASNLEMPGEVFTPRLDFPINFTL